MKHKLLALMILSIGSLQAFAGEVEIPKNVLDLHTLTCPEFASDRGQYMVKEVHELKTSTLAPTSNKLIVLGCEMYAYNTMERAYILTNYGEIIPVAVAEVDEDGNFSATTRLMGGGFDPETQELGTFYKGRGIADCGSSARYKYNSKNDSFTLVEQRLKVECDEQDTDWPVVFPKK